MEPFKTGDTIEHLGGNIDRYCSSQRFVLRWEEQADRDTALAALAGEDGKPCET